MPRLITASIVATMAVAIAVTVGGPASGTPPATRSSGDVPVCREMIDSLYVEGPYTGYFRDGATADVGRASSSVELRVGDSLLVTFPGESPPSESGRSLVPSCRADHILIYDVRQSGKARVVSGDGAGRVLTVTVDPLPRLPVASRSCRLLAQRLPLLRLGANVPYTGRATVRTGDEVAVTTAGLGGPFSRPVDLGSRLLTPVCVVSATRTKPSLTVFRGVSAGSVPVRAISVVGFAQEFAGGTVTIRG